MIGNVNSNGGLTMTGLWTNQAPSSNFSAQTVSLNLSSYDAVLIEFNTIASDSNSRGSMVCLKNGVTHTLFSAVTGNTTLRTRGATVSDTGITFTTGYQGTSSNTQNIIPYKIYGLRGL